MNVRDELTIFKMATEKAIISGFLENEGLGIKSVDIIFDPPSLRIAREPLHQSDNNDIYLSTTTPLIDSDWALGFWGKQMTGDAFLGNMPAWQYHQFKLLQFIQEKDWESYFNYISLFNDR